MPVERSRCDLAEIAARVREDLSRWQPRREIDLEAAGPIEVVCDGALVQRVLENLVGNGIRHTPAEGRLRIALEETTDEAADRRRLRKICAVLDRHRGELPVELLIKLRSGDDVRLSRGAVDASATERMVPEINALLGVLGDVAEVGRPETAARELAAVGG